MKRNWLIVGAAIIVLIVIIAIWASTASRGAIYIAVAAPLGDNPSPDGLDTQRGAELFATQFNQLDSINGKKIVVEMFNDENNVDVAVEKAKEIAAAGKYMLVIGHSLSSASIAAGEIYQEAGIPAISGSATAERLTSENEWYFRVIPNSRSQSVFVANYVYRILGYDKAAIVYDVDAFGVSLADAFEDAFIELGGEIAEQFSLDRNQSDLEDRVNEIAAELAQLPDGPGIIFYATHANEGANLIVALKQQQGKVYPGVGASAFSNINFIEKFNELYEEQYIPGFFSDGIFTVAPVVFDVADVAGQMFRDDFLSTYQEEPGMKAATNYDALLVAVQAMKRAGIIGNKSDIENERKKLRDALADINSIDEAVNGVTGLVYFDEVGDIIKPATMMGVYQQGHRISALHQLMPVTNPARVIDLVNEVKEGRIIEVEDQYLYKTKIIYTGMDINKVSNLDVKNAAYTMDFYLWFRFKDEFDDRHIEFVNAEGNITLGDPIAEEISDELIYRAYRVKGKFTNEFRFQNYPFDAHSLFIRFRHLSFTRERLIYVRDMVGMRGASSEDTIQRFKETGVLDKDTGWFATRALFYPDILINDSTLGNPKFFGMNSEIEFSRFNTEIGIERDVLGFSIKNLLPLFILVFLSYLIFYFPINQFGTINGIIRGVLLTVAFFHLKLSSDLPGVNYLVALDYIFYLLYTLFVLELVFSLVANQLNQDEENKELVKRLFLGGRIIFPIIIIISMVIVWMNFLKT